MELYQLQKEIREMRQQNLEGQKNIQYIPFNIISNNLYINNSLNKSSMNPNLPRNNITYNSFMSEKQSEKKRQLDQKRRIPLGKFPIKKGMFSYKTSINYLNNYNYNELYRNNSQNVIEVKEPNYNYNNYKQSNNSLLSAELKLNLDDNYVDHDTIEQNKNMGERVFSTSSLNLNKYKINKNNVINQKQNILGQNNYVNNYPNKMNSNNNYPNNSNNNSFNLSKNKSQIIGKNQNNNEIKPNLSMAVENKKKKVKKIADHFRNSETYEKESRRMIIEYIKILNKKEAKNHSLKNIENILKKNNISKRVLNMEYNLEEFNSMNLFNYSNIKEKNKTNKNEDINIRKKILFNSFDNNYNAQNYKETNNQNKIITKNISTPIKKNITNFLNKMDDIKKDKINMISFLSVPRIMDLYFLNKKYKFIFVLYPSNISYKNAIESYIFKFTDIKTKQIIGGFDLVKVKICLKIPNKPNNFNIETYDGKTYKNYEFVTKSPNIANNYVKAINYIAQLVKCKLYNFKNK